MKIGTDFWKHTEEAGYAYTLSSPEVLLHFFVRLYLEQLSHWEPRVMDAHMGTVPYRAAPLSTQPSTHMHVQTYTFVGEYIFIVL